MIKRDLLLKLKEYLSKKEISFIVGPRKEGLFAKIYLWRTKEGGEVNFVIDSAKTLTPLEIKYRDLKEPEMSRSLRNFIERYTPSPAPPINLYFRHTLSIG